jgi:GT2 family glycosyltransferase
MNEVIHMYYRVDQTLMSIVIVTYNTKTLLLECLKSIYSLNNGPKIEVIVVDNNSSDGTAIAIKKHYPQAKIIINKTNEGFAKGNNRAIKISSGRYIMFLNSDTVVPEQMINKMLGYMEDNPKVGVLGCKLIRRDGKIQLSAAWFPNIFSTIWGGEIIPKGLGRIFKVDKFPGQIYLTEKMHNSIQEVDWIVGACMIVRREVNIEAGIFDENIFLYGEEVEWCFRIKKIGWKVVYYPYAYVYHYGLEKPDIRRKETIERSIKGARYFYYKYHSRLSSIINDLVLLIIAIYKTAFWATNYFVNRERNGCRLHLQYNFAVIKEMIKTLEID